MPDRRGYELEMAGGTKPGSDVYYRIGKPIRRGLTHNFSCGEEKKTLEKKPF